MHGNFTQPKITNKQSFYTCLSRCNLARISIFYIFISRGENGSHAVDSLVRIVMCTASLSHRTAIFPTQQSPLIYSWIWVNFPEAYGKPEWNSLRIVEFVVCFMDVWSRVELLCVSVSEQVYHRIHVMTLYIHIFYGDWNGWWRARQRHQYEKTWPLLVGIFHFIVPLTSNEWHHMRRIMQLEIGMLLFGQWQHTMFIYIWTILEINWYSRTCFCLHASSIAWRNRNMIVVPNELLIVFPMKNQLMNYDTQR